MADWDKFSVDYDRIFSEYPQYRYILKRMTELLEDANGKSVLDLGCGTGNLMAAVLEAYPEVKLSGIDPSEGMRQACAQRLAGRENVQVTAGDALEIPFDDGKFDFVMTNLALHHVAPDDRVKCAREMARVLKEGGSLLYSDMFCDVDGPPGDPRKARDIIEKITGVALYCLDHGAYDMMMIMLKTLPVEIAEEGEYVTTPGVWMDALRQMGFERIDVMDIPPGEFGLKILRATL
ncbi:MAG: class I SAM-dependent methyltransferase [Actinobacteria bacterium]|nr:class I SAM-dependent methyltransferase [Actinomycetota bacterium]